MIVFALLISKNVKCLFKHVENMYKLYKLEIF